MCVQVKDSRTSVVWVVHLVGWKGHRVSCLSIGPIVKADRSRHWITDVPQYYQRFQRLVSSAPSIGVAPPVVPEGCAVGGLPIKVNLSQDGSSSERASRSHDDYSIELVSS